MLLRVIHIVGCPPQKDPDYLPMMWEVSPVCDPDDRWFQFNYIRGRNPLGLSRAAVFDVGNLSTILAMYRDRTGASVLPLT
jgi:hypothetical protein